MVPVGFALLAAGAERVVSVLKVLSPQPAAFDAQHLATLELMAGLLGAA